MTLPEEYEIDMATGLPRKKRRRLPFSDPLEGILEEEGDEQQRPPKRPPISFTPEQRRKYGGVAPYLDLIKIPFEEYKRLYPGVSEYDLGDLYPEEFGKRKPLPEQDIDDLLGNVFPGGLSGFKGGEIKQLMGGEPELFVNEVFKRGRTPDTEALLRYFDEDPDEFFRLPLPPTTSERALATLGFQERPVENLVKQIFPGTNLRNFIKFIDETPDQFVEAMRSGGWSKTKQDLLQALGLDENEIQKILGTGGLEYAESAPVLHPEPEWRNNRTGEVITASEKAKRFPKGYEAELDEWALTAETARNYGGVFKVFAESLTKVPKQFGAAILQAVQGQGGASVVNKDWADKWIAEAATDQEAFVSKVTEQYKKTRLPVNIVDVADLPQNIAFSLTSMGAGLAVGVPIALAPVPGARFAAWLAGTAASGAVAYNMTTYQIMQQYLEVKNDEMKAQLGRGLTANDEEMLKRDFSNQAMQYGLWEAVPEAISNLAFAQILGGPLGKMLGKTMATRIIGKLVSLYGEELLTETVTQKMQSDIEVEAGLRENKISWIEAFKEVAPQTFLLTTILGGAGQVSVSAVQKIKQSLKREAGDSAVFKAINENITENVFNELEAEAIANLELKVPATAKAIRDVKSELTEQPTGAGEPTPLEASELASLRRFKADLEKELPTATPEKAKELTRDLRTTEFRIRDLQEKMGKGAPEAPEAISIKGEAGVTKPKVAPAPEVTKGSVADIKIQLSKMSDEEILAIDQSVKRSVAQTLGISGKSSITDIDTFLLKTRSKPAIPKAPAGIPEAGVQEIGQPEAPKPSVARPGVAEVAKGEVPPAKPPPTAVVPPKPPKPPVEQVAERISFEPDKQSLKEKFQSGKNKAIVHWIDKLYPIDKFVSQAKKTGVELGIEENPYLLARLLEGVTSKASNFIENGTFTRKFWKTEKGKTVPDYKGAGLSQILESVKEPQAWRDFSTYLTAVHAQELAKLDIKTGIEPDVATSAIKELESKYPNFSKLADKVQKYQKQLLDYVQESGLISEDLRAKLDAKYYAYVPFYRVMDELQAGGYMGKKMADIASPIKRIKGSEREIINPLESIIKNTYAMINAADRNQVGVAMARIAHDVPDVAPMFQHIKTPIAKVATVTAKELGIEITGLSETETEEVFNIFRPSMFKAENVATVMIEGKKQFFEVDPDLNKALHALDQGSMGILWKVLSAPAKWLRAGATLSPDFMIRNPARDALSAFVYSKYGFIPGLDFMKGVVSILRKDADYKLYKMSGAEHSMLVSLDREYLQKSFKEVVEGKKFTDYVKHPLALFQIASELGEKATRLGEFKLGLAKGATPLEAGMASREVTLDFAKAGTQAKAVNQIIAFFNASIRSWDRLITAFKEAPVRTSTNIFLGITLPSILLYLVNRDDDRWKEIPQWQKDLFWIVMTKDTINRIPKPFELGLLFGSGPERLLEYLDTKDPELFKNLWASIWEAGTPGWLPTGLAPIIENITNHSFFRGTPIVSEGKQALPPEFQYTQYSSEVAKGLGNLLKQSPAKIDNLIQGWTGGLGRYAMQGIDKLLRGTGIVPPKIEPSPTAADIPVLRAFVVRNPIGSASKSVNEFYDVLEEYTAQEQRLKTLLEDGKKSEYETEKAKHPELFVFFDEKTNTVYSATARFLRQVSGELSDIRKLEDKVYKSTDMTPEKKRELIDGLETIKTQLAQKALALIKNPGNEAGILEVPAKELEDKLGSIINPVSPISNEKPERYKTPELARELRQVEGESKLSALLAKNNAILAEVALLPDSALYKIDRSVTRTGLTRRQNELLDQYDAATDKKAFIEEHPEIEVNPKTEWLKREPESNAILALWGNAKILTQEAYDIVQGLIKNGDVPDNGLPEGAVPPKEVAKEYFAYNDAVGKFSANSWEAQLIVAKSDKLREFLKREPIETPIASLELKTIPKYREIDDKLNKEDNPDFIGNLDDKIKDANGLTARDRARAALMDTKIPGTDLTYRDMERKVKAIELGTNEKPTDTKIVDAHVAYMRLQDAPGVGPNTAEVELAKIDQAGDVPKLNAYGQWRLDNKLDKEAPDFTRVPIWNIDAKYRKEDAAYQAILDKYEGSDETAEAKAYLAGNDDYRKDRRRRQAYKLTNSKTGEAFPRDQVENFVTYNEYEEKGFRQERMLLEDPAFAKAMHEIKGKDIPDPKTVPAVQYDDIYDQYKAQFDKLDEVAEIDVAEPGLTLDQTREKARNALRYDAKGNLTDFGKAEISRNGYKTLIGKEEHIDNWNELYNLPESGFRRDRLLKDNPDFYKQVWLGIMKNDTKKFDSVPDVEYDNLYDEFKEQFDKWDAYGEPKNKKLYIADPDERRIMREILLRENSGFSDARIKQAAYSLLIGNEKYVPEYVEYEKKLAEGKPKGAEIWRQSDRYLKEHQGFYRKMRELGYWTQDVDFTKIPTEKFEGLYNTQYTQLDTDKPRRALRATNPWFDDEGAKLGFWKVIDEKEREALLTGGPYTRPPSLGLGELDEILKKPILKVK